MEKEAKRKKDKVKADASPKDEGQKDSPASPRAEGSGSPLARRKSKRDTNTGSLRRDSSRKVKEDTTTKTEALVDGPQRSTSKIFLSGTSPKGAEVCDKEVEKEMMKIMLESSPLSSPEKKKRKAEANDNETSKDPKFHSPSKENIKKSKNKRESGNSNASVSPSCSPPSSPVIPRPDNEAKKEKKKLLAALKEDKEQDSENVMQEKKGVADLDGDHGEGKKKKKDKNSKKEQNDDKEEEKEHKEKDKKGKKHGEDEKKEDKLEKEHKDKDKKGKRHEEDKEDKKVEKLEKEKNDQEVKKEHDVEECREMEKPEHKDTKKSKKEKKKEDKEPEKEEVEDNKETTKQKKEPSDKEHKEHKEKKEAEEKIITPTISGDGLQADEDAEKATATSPSGKTAGKRRKFERSHTTHSPSSQKVPKERATVDGALSEKKKKSETSKLHKQQSALSPSLSPTSLSPSPAVSARSNGDESPRKGSDSAQLLSPSTISPSVSPHRSSVELSPNSGRSTRSTSRLSQGDSAAHVKTADWMTERERREGTTKLSSNRSRSPSPSPGLDRRAFSPIIPATKAAAVTTIPKLETPEVIPAAPTSPLSYREIQQRRQLQRQLTDNDGTTTAARPPSKSEMAFPPTGARAATTLKMSQTARETPHRQLRRADTERNKNSPENNNTRPSVIPGNPTKVAAKPVSEQRKNEIEELRLKTEELKYKIEQMKIQQQLRLEEEEENRRREEEERLKREEEERLRQEEEEKRIAEEEANDYEDENTVALEPVPLRTGNDYLAMLRNMQMMAMQNDASEDQEFHEEGTDDDEDEDVGAEPRYYSYY